MRLYLDPSALQSAAADAKVAYATARPFPHAVLDGLLPEDALDLASRAVPSPDSTVWKEYENYHEMKLEAQGEDRLGDDLSLLLYQFNSAPFLDFLEELSGIRGLLPDPYFSGGGVHQIVRGGKLGVHADFSRHPKYPLHRRLNVLIYLNRDWREEWGGDLELWDYETKECVRKIAPLYNRMVVFSITDWALHGHPDPLDCPPDVTRKSIALYYYTAERPLGETKATKNATLFFRRPGERVPRGVIDSRDGYSGVKDAAAMSPARMRAQRIAKEWTPPILFDAFLSWRRRAKARHERPGT